MKELFIWEIKKNVKRKAIIGIGVAALVVLILLAIVYNLLADLIKDLMDGNVPDGVEVLLPEDEEGEDSEEAGMPPITLEEKITKEELLALKISTEEELKYYEKESEKDKASYYAPIYEAKSKLKEIDYALEHGYYDKEVNLLGLNYSLGMGLSAEGFVSMYISVLTLIVAIYGVIFAANTFNNEYKLGSIKLVMTRPIKKNSLTVAKLLAMYATLTVMYALPVLIAFIYGAAAFGLEASTRVVYSFNASGAGVTTAGALMFGQVMAQYLKIIIVATFAFATGTVTRNSTVGLIASLLVLLGVGSFFSRLGITAFTLSNAFNFMSFFGVESYTVYIGNFFLSIAVMVFWLALSIAGTLVAVQKRDIN